MRRINSPLTLFNRTLAAGPESAAGVNGLINATGTKLFCKAALQPFKVKLDTGEAFDFEEGFSYEMAEGDFFSRIELLNPNAAALDVSLYVGNARIWRAAPLLTRDARTTIAGGQGTFPVGTYVLIGTLGTVAPGKHRKQVVITNTEAAGSAWIIRIYRQDPTNTTVLSADVAYGPLLTIYPGQSITLFTSDVLVMNGTSTKGYQFLETYYS